MPKVHVSTTVTIDLADISMVDLVAELERRGRHEHFRNYSTADLLEELASRVVQRFGEVNILLMALSDMGCPSDLIQPIEKWAAEPVATPLKLKEWIELCSQGEGGHPI